MACILVAEDDHNINKLVCAALRRVGYESLAAFDGVQALEVLETNRIDLIITDIMMPRMDGLELTRSLREAGYNIPILMLTAKQMQQDKREGFIAGADDYLVKPFDIQELALRVRALLRRANVNDERTLIAGSVALDGNSLTVSCGTESQTLPHKEFQLLFKLLSNPGKAFTRMQLLEDVWGWNTESSESTVKVHINRLRTRFSDWDSFEIQTIRGLGYRAVIREGAEHGQN